MKKITCLLFLVFICFTTNAQTTLTKGDIAFVGSNTSGATNADDNFSFVLLKNIEANTEIIFTDRGWTDIGGFSNFLGDGEFTWVSTTNRSAGEIISLDLSALNPASAAYSYIGDQLFAIQGTIVNPIFIAGINFNHEDGVSTDENWDGASTDNTTSALPNELLNGTNAIRLIDTDGFESDNWQFSCTKAGGINYTSYAEAALAINNRDNWQSNSNSYDPAIETGCEFIICNTPDTPSLTLSSNNLCPETATTINISGDLNGAVEWVIYSTSCGGTKIGSTTGNSFEVTPPNGDTTYFIRGEDGTGCIDENTATCASIIVNSEDLTIPSAIAQDLTIQLDENGIATITPDQINNGSTDNCTADVDLALSLDRTNFDCSDVQGSHTALDFDGQDDYVEIASPYYQFGNEITVSWWVKFDNDSAFMTQSTENVDDMSTNVWLMHSADANGIAWYVNDGGIWRSVAATSTAGWHLITGTADALAIKLYIDGIEVGSTTGINSGIRNNLNSVIHIGKDSRYPTSSGRVNKFSADDIIVYNKALTLSEIESLKTDNPNLNDLNLKGYWNFNEATGDIANDLSATNAQGALVNMDPSTDWITSGTTIKSGNTVTLTVTDAAGNSSTATATVTVEDKIAPEITCPANIEVDNDSGTDGAIVNYSLPLVLDECTSVNNIINGSFEQGDYSGWTISSSNPSCGSFLIGEDGETFTTGPHFDYADNTNENQSSPNLPFNIAATDGQFMAVFLQNCSSTHRMYQDINVDQNSVLKLDLGYNNTTSFDANNQYIAIAIKDVNTDNTIEELFKTEAGDALSIPVTAFSFDLSAYANQAIRLEVIQATINNSYFDVFLDNIHIEGFQTIQTAGLSSDSEFPIGTTTNTFEVTDSSGNKSTCSFTVTVNDVEAPKDYTVSIDQVEIDKTNETAVGFTFAAAEVGATYNYTFNSDIGGTDVTGTGTISTATDQITGIDLSGLEDGTITLSVTLTDEAINEGDAATDTVIKNTNEAPVAVCKAFTAQLDASGNVIISPNDVDGGSTDDKEGFTLSLDKHSFNCSNLGENIIELTITDSDGVKSSCAATVTVEDNTPPGITCLANIEVDNDSGVDGAVVDFEINTSDNCSISKRLTKNNEQFTGGVISCNNPAFRRGFMVIYDLNKEGIAGDFFLENLDIGFGSNSNDIDITVNLYYDTAIQNEISTYDVPLSDNIIPFATTTVKLNFDNTNFIQSIPFNISLPTNSIVYVEVVTPQSIVLPTSIDPTQKSEFGLIFSCENSSNYRDFGSEGAQNTFIISMQGREILNPVQTAGLSSGSEFPVGTTTNTFEVTDASGNKSTCSFDVTVNDVEAPKDYTVSIDQAEIDETNETAVSFTFAAAEVGAFYNYSFSSGNGATFSIGTGTIATATDQITGINLSDLEDGTITLSVTLFDEAGNEGDAATDTVIKNTNEAPVAVCQVFTAQLDASGNVIISPNNVDGGSTDDKEGFTLSLDKDSFNCSNLGENIIELTITDSDGVKSSCAATVTVEDNIAPIIASIGDIEVDTDAGICGAVVNYDITATDNCDNSTSGKVLIIWDVLNEHTINLKDALTNAGLDVTMSETSETNYDGTNPSLENFDAVIHLNGTTYAQGMPIAGQNALVDFVLSQGKTYITEEWSAYEIDTQNTMTNMSEIVILTRTSGTTQSNTYEIIPTESDHPILKDIPNAITLPIGGSNVGGLRTYANNPAIALMNFSQGVGVAIREFEGGGAAVGFAHAGNFGNSTLLSDSNIQNLYINSAKFNNSSIKSIQTAGLLSGSEFPVGTTTNTFEVSDASGNKTTSSFDVTVVDKELPAVVTQEVTIYLDENGKASTTAEAVNNGSYDNCTIESLSLSKTEFDCSNVGNNTVKLTVNDVNGNESTADANVMVVDEVAAIAVAKDITVQLDETGNVSITAEDVDNGSDDACGIQSMSISPNSFTCSEVGENTVTLTVVDNNGNESTTTSTVTVEDNVAAIAIAKDITVQLDETGNVSITAEDIDNGSNDACGIASLSVSPSAFTCAEVGDNTVTLTVIDNNGNESSNTAIVTVEDNIIAIAIAKDITVQLDDTGNVEITAEDIDNGSNDACGIASMSVSPNTFTCAEVGENTVTLTVIDNNGNEATTTSTVTVEDNVAAIAIAKDITVQLDDTGNVSITAEDIDNGSNDACGIASMSVSPSAFTCAEVGDNTVTLTVIDNNGNESTTTSTVTVEDDIAAIAIAKDITVQLDDTGNVMISAEDVDNDSNDACGIASMSVSPSTFTCAEVGDNTVTLTVVDNNGNESTTTSTVKVEDNVAAIAIAKDITVQLDDTGNVSITAEDVDNESNDACGIASMSISPSAFTCAEVGENTVTLTVIDNNGNESTTTSTVTVEDNVAAIATAKDITVLLDDSGNVSITAEDIDNGSNDACGIASMSVSPSTFTCAEVGENTVTLTVVDNNGNKSTTTSTVTVEDKIAPVPSAVSLSDITSECEILEADVTVPTASDNCGGTIKVTHDASFPITTQGLTVITWSFEDANGNIATQTQDVMLGDLTAPVPDVESLEDIIVECEAATIEAPTATDTCAGTVTGTTLDPTSYSEEGEFMILWEFNDGNGNVSTQEQWVTVKDNTAPEVITQDLTVIVTQDEPAMITPEEVNDGSTDNCSELVYTLDRDTFDKPGVYEVVLTATDASGNTSQATATITVKREGADPKGAHVVPTMLTRSTIAKVILPFNGRINEVHVMETETNNYKVFEGNKKNTMQIDIAPMKGTLLVKIIDAEGNVYMKKLIAL